MCAVKNQQNILIIVGGMRTFEFFFVSGGDSHIYFFLHKRLGSGSKMRVRRKLGQKFPVLFDKGILS